MIHGTAEVRPDVELAPDVVVWAYVQVLGPSRIGRGTSIGRLATVGPHSDIGELVKIQTGAQIYGARVGSGCFIGPGSVLVEDPRPRATTPSGSRKRQDEYERRPVVLGRGASVGAMCVVLPGVHVGDFALIGAGSVVHRDVPAYSIAAGNPARVVGRCCECGVPAMSEPCGDCGVSLAADGMAIEHAG